MDNKYVLLTGAGFTHNFGAPLSKDMSAEIFNNESVQKEKRVRDLMINNNFDFETVYSTIMSRNYSVEEKNAIKNAVNEVYLNLDVIVKNYSFREDSLYPINIYNLQKLINQFSLSNKKGFIFTLNQDLFLERHYYNGTKPTMPGINIKQGWFSSIYDVVSGSGEYLTLPDGPKVRYIREQFYQQKNGFYYFKLHGSQNWISDSGDQRLIIGKSKEEDINGEPLLALYFDIFKNTLMCPNVRLLIIGYGFGDDHINSVIEKAIKENGLKLYIINPEPIDNFHNKHPKNQFMLNSFDDGFTGYFPYKLLKIFPKDQSLSQECKNVYKNFFNIIKK